jgi:alkylhydroperoxidase family enzyme
MREMDALADVPWESCTLDPHVDPELERWVRRMLGFAPPPTRYFSRCPWIMRAFVRFDESLLPLEHIDLQTARFIALVVSQDNSCRFCYAANRSVLKFIGVPDEVVSGLEQDLLVAADPDLRDDLAFARSVSRADPVPADEYRRLVSAGRARGRMQEIAFVAACHTYYNRLATLPALPLVEVEHMLDSWWMRLLRPVIAWKMQRPSSTRVDDSGVDMGATPFPYLIDALRPLSIARPLAAVLCEAWESPALDERTRALCFAVIARGLGASVAEREAHALLVRAGMGEDQVRTALANLAAPGMSNAEVAVARFARDTIRYKPAIVQRSARALRGVLEPEQYVDVLGITSLANAVCRLEVVLA